ncbi:MAG: PspC domain-containing protein [Coriobacteriales bacterium]|jgi:phage shock protein C|nr:PspC domain-containing protein [Coriobacteriales bacterium]
MNTNKRLYKSNDPVFAGVCGGVAEYFELDPTLIRILAVIFVLAGFGLPLLVYIIAMIVMPKRSDDYSDYIDVKPTPAQSCASSSATRTASVAGAGGSANVDPTVGVDAGVTGGGASTTAGVPIGAAAGVPIGAAAGVPIGAAAGVANTAQGSPFAERSTPPHVTWASTEATATPGRAYTTCNPQAYDATDPSGQAATKKRPWYSIRTSVMLGILLVGVGLLALLGIFLEISLWRFWPMLIIIMGFAMLCTPGSHGWSLLRAGHAILMITVGFALQLWMLDIIASTVFLFTFLSLWPILLVVVGLSIIGSATRQSVFGLFGSLLVSAALLFGIWSFGQISIPLRFDGPGAFDFQIIVPTPPPDFLAPQNDLWPSGQ